MTPRLAWRFSKMHGAGNDFVILDLRGALSPPEPAVLRAMADRHTGIGFDQLLTIEDRVTDGCAARYRIWNGDGSMAQQCGNGARCVAAWLQRAGAILDDQFLLDSPAGPVAAQRVANGHYAIAMGVPDFRPEHVPLMANQEALRYVLATAAGEIECGAVSMGNPHAVLAVADAARADVASIGPAVQACGRFVEGVNVGFAEIVTRTCVRLRVFERGAGETLACGSGACAAVAVLVRWGLIDRQVMVELAGGTLAIDWPSDDAAITMAGPATFVFEGEFPA